MASVIFGVPPSSVTSDQRDLGKQAILGLSYGMGADKFRTSCMLKGMNISNSLAERAKNAFREKHARMVQLWYQIDRFTKEATMFWAGGGVYQAGRIKISGTKMGGTRCLLVQLPSGRQLYYREPMIVDGQLTYFGQIPMTQTWGRIKLYGAKIFENVCQAIAADLMSYGARRAESNWMVPFALIHDQALAIQTAGQKPDQFAAALQQLPPWATGLPLKAEAKLTEYYQK